MSKFPQGQPMHWSLKKAIEESIDGPGHFKFALLAILTDSDASLFLTICVFRNDLHESTANMRVNGDGWLMRHVTMGNGYKLSLRNDSNYPIKTSIHYLETTFQFPIETQIRYLKWLCIPTSLASLSSFVHSLLLVNLLTPIHQCDFRFDCRNLCR